MHIIMKMRLGYHQTTRCVRRLSSSNIRRQCIGATGDFSNYLCSPGERHRSRRPWLPQYHYFYHSSSTTFIDNQQPIYSSDDADEELEAVVKSEGGGGFRVHNMLSSTANSSINNNNNNDDDDLIDYRYSWAWQHLYLSRRLAARRRQQSNENQNYSDDDDDIILLLEHLPVYTLGRGADENHLTFLSSDEDRAALSRKNRGGARLTIDKTVTTAEWLTLPDEVAVEQLATRTAPSIVVSAPNGVPVYRVERGGEVTFHGPGQLVVYPLFDLKRPPFRDDLHWFLRQIEEVVILTLKEYGIHGVRDEINTGVWVGPNKIAAVGVAASRWITTHGLALNVNPDLEYFDTSLILPCGVPERGVTSIAGELQGRSGGTTDGDFLESKIPTVPQVANVLLEKMEEVFGITGLVNSTDESVSHVINLEMAAPAG